ncbi:hypothetical protein Ocin01_15595 [Orchesella cincta]|uniref:Uncharacterized protein n=1 Tax=Orchesella cincta TaxID=48709 RepID=A0A1D2MDK0_ORCCI|nr:hypothetical protein Ocin01_15595 [Orchesella cincta]
MGGIFSSEPESKRHEVLLLKEAVQTFKIGKSQPYPIINCLYDGTKDRQKLCEIEIESNKKDGHQICLSEFLDDFTPQDFSNNVILLLLGGPQSSSEISVKTDFSERFVEKTTRSFSRAEIFHPREFVLKS